MDTQQQQKKQPPAKPNETGKIKVSEFLKITDAQTKQTIVEKKA